MSQKINLSDLIPFDIFLGNEPITIDLVYADASHPRNIFDKDLYHSSARIWAHKDLAAVTLLTARTIHQKYGWVLEVQDCLRTIDTQKSMQETDIVKTHPEWMEGANRLLAPAGHGGHPRGMAIDVAVIDDTKNHVDMGTLFDEMVLESARNYQGFSDEINANRQNLENAFVISAKALNLPLLPLPSEWWDFRFPADYYNQHTPLSDADLPPQMQMTNKTDNNIENFDDAHFQKLADSTLALVEQAYENI